MFLLGLVSTILVGAIKLYDMHHGNPYRLVTESPYFYISLTTMIWVHCFSLRDFWENSFREILQKEIITGLRKKYRIFI